MNTNFEIAKEILLQKGEIVGPTSGNSMKPLFRSGKDKAVIIAPPPVWKPNNVLLYRSRIDGNITLHRVIKVTPNGLVIRGDNLYRNETGITSNDIVGKLKAFYRNGKYYECETSISYKMYVFYIRTSYPIRYIAHKAFNFTKRVIKKLLG